MSLQAGHKLAHYEILEPIGKGGMGEVYRARDTKLGRDVALKTLPEELAGDEERLARFDREARLLASLNHPKIAALYGLEDADGTRFLVMELVLGETLAERLRSGPLSLEQVLAIARQIAEALEAAHEKGVIHRDLKPGNIMVTADDGGVKVLDFGLAKAFATEAGGDSGADRSHSPTLTRQATVAGVIVGTASYMSPEQARGKSVDKRADIFAFGCVLYEMLTGRKAFGGEDISDVLASVIKLEPDWNALSPDVPPRVRELLRRCLEKDPKSRRRDIGDVRLEIEEMLAAPKPEREHPPISSAAPIPSRWPLTTTTAAITFLAFGLLVSLATWHLKPSAPRPDPMAFAHVLPDGQSFSVGSSQFLSVSPDGQRIVYAADNQLYVRNLDALEAVPIRGTEGDPRNPFFSPDGQWIGFHVVAGELRKVAAAGGAFVKLCDVSGVVPFGISWAPDGSILFVQADTGIMTVPEAGGTPEVLVPAEDGERFYGPQMLPGGESLLFTRSDGDWDDARIVVRSLESGEQTTVVARGTDGRYLSSGHLVYAVENTIFAVAFDLDALEVSGVPVPMVENVRRASATGGAQFSVSENGVLAYVPTPEDLGAHRLVWVDRSGQTTPLSEKREAYARPRLSPDGARLAVEIGDDLWIHEIGPDTSARFTTEGRNRAPVWFPDGASITFRSQLGDDAVMSHRRSDFSSPAESTEIEGFPYAWALDGKLLLFGRADIDTDTGPDIWALPSDGEARPVLRTPAWEFSPALSPDGKWMAFTSNESGQFDIYVQPFPGPGRRWTLSTHGGAYPVWSPRGGELFYIEQSQRLMAIDVTTEPDFQIGAPRTLFEKTFQTGAGIRDYDVAPDGTRFVMVEAGESGGPSRQQINIVLGWFQELERLAPGP